MENVPTGLAQICISVENWDDRMASILPLRLVDVLTIRAETSIIEYLDQISNGAFTRDSLKKSLGQAKKVLGTILDKDTGGIGDIKTKTKLTTFSLPVAEQLVACVGQSLQGQYDESRTSNE